MIITRDKKNRTTEVKKNMKTYYYYCYRKKGEKVNEKGEEKGKN